MTGATPTTPAGWAGVFIEWMHPASLALAVALPVVRAAIRKSQNQLPCFQSSYVVHDAASGLTLPSFCALFFSGISPDLASHVDGHAAILAGLMGVIYTIANIVKGHGPAANGDSQH